MEQKLHPELTRTMTALLCKISKCLPDDVYTRLRQMQQAEKGALGQELYVSMFGNLELAAKLDRPICQDTGLPMFFIKAGTAFPHLERVKASFAEAVRQATKIAPLRPNAVDPFLNKNTGDNTGAGTPWFEWEIVPGSDRLEVTVYLSGGGCSLPGRAQVLMPSEGWEGVAEFVLDAFVEYGVNACPPLLVGVGVGASAETAALLSKKALLRKIGTRNPSSQAAEMENMLMEALQSLGIGPQGLPGTSAVMGVHLEYAARHTATLAVGLSVGCWAHRRATIVYHPDLSYEILTHSEVVL